MSEFSLPNRLVLTEVQTRLALNFKNVIDLVLKTEYYIARLLSAIF